MSNRTKEAFEKWKGLKREYVSQGYKKAHELPIGERIRYWEATLEANSENGLNSKQKLKRQEKAMHRLIKALSDKIIKQHCA